MSYNDDYLLPIVQPRNIAEPRKFNTKWDVEINKKGLRKRAINRDRDTKYREEDTYEHLESQPTQDYADEKPYVVQIYIDPLVKNEPSEFIHVADLYYIQLPCRFVSFWPPTVQDFTHALGRTARHTTEFLLDWYSWLFRYYNH